MKMKDYGGPAFPTLHIPDASPPAWSGMTLRDYFAAKAMITFWMDPEITDCNRDLDSVARWSYEMADAMLKAREEGGAA